MIYDTMKFSVYGQLMKKYNAVKVVANTGNYLKTEFMFSEDWDGVTKTAFFEYDGVGYGQILVDDKCYVPWEVIKTPYFKITVCGSNNGKVIRTTEMKINVAPSGTSELQVSLSPTPDIYQQILDLLASKQDTLVPGDGIVINDGNVISAVGINTEADSIDDFPTEGVAGQLYIDKTNSTIYRWDLDTHQYVIVANNWNNIEEIDSDAIY